MIKIIFGKLDKVRLTLINQKLSPVLSPKVSPSIKMNYEES